MGLLNALIEECRMLGFRQFIAVIGDGGPSSASVRLHERAGLRHCGVLRGSGYKHERWLDTAFMQLELNGGDTRPPDEGSLPERMFRRDGLGPFGPKLETFAGDQPATDRRVQSPTVKHRPA